MRAAGEACPCLPPPVWHTQAQPPRHRGRLPRWGPSHHPRDPHPRLRPRAHRAPGASRQGGQQRGRMGRTGPAGPRVSQEGTAPQEPGPLNLWSKNMMSLTKGALGDGGRRESELTSEGSWCLWNALHPGRQAGHHGQGLDAQPAGKPWTGGTDGPEQPGDNSHWAAGLLQAPGTGHCSRVLPRGPTVPSLVLSPPQSALTQVGWTQSLGIQSLHGSLLGGSTASFTPSSLTPGQASTATF